jgi:hypothetical protein
MTFMVSQEGAVWQRDLGERTSELAAAIQRFNPDSMWTPIPPESAPSAGAPSAGGTSDSQASRAPAGK